MAQDRFERLRKLSKEDRNQLFQFAMQRSDQILRGIESQRAARPSTEPSPLHPAEEPSGNAGK